MIQRSVHTSNSAQKDWCLSKSEVSLSDTKQRETRRIWQTPTFAGQAVWDVSLQSTDIKDTSTECYMTHKAWSKQPSTSCCSQVTDSLFV